MRLEVIEGHCSFRNFRNRIFMSPSAQVRQKSRFFMTTEKYCWFLDVIVRARVCVWVGV